MPPLPPLRTRQGVRTEPHISQPRQNPTPQRGEPSFHVREPQPSPAPTAPSRATDDDDFPVLTNIVEQPAPAATLAPSPSPPAPAIDLQAQEDELVDRITAHVLAALRPSLEDTVADAVRQALQERPER